MTSTRKAKAVDPGSYEIIAKAPGKKTWTKKVDVAAGSAIVTVEVPKLEAAAADPTVVPTPPSAASSEPASHDTTPPRAGKGHGPSLAVLRPGRLAVAGFSVGTIMAIKYSNANMDAKATCPTSVGCSPVQISFHDQRVDQARSARTWSVIGFGVGAVVWVRRPRRLLLPQSSESEHALTATPLVAADGSFGASLSGKL